MTELVRITRGVWRAPESVDDLAGRCAALLSVLPRDSAVAGRTAARLHGLWLPAAEATEVPEIIVRGTSEIPRNHARSGRPEMRIRRRRLRPDCIIHVDGVPVTALSTTWLHLAEHLVLADLVAAGDSALRSGALAADLADVVMRSRRQRGVSLARAALPLLDARSRSRPESWLRVGLVTRGLRPSGVNTPVHDEHGQWLGEPDLSYDDVRLALEYNGRCHADLDRMRKDITREVDFAERGRWYTLTLGPAEVFRRMDRVAMLVRDLREERGVLLRSRLSVGFQSSVLTFNPTSDA